MKVSLQCFHSCNSSAKDIGDREKMKKSEKGKVSELKFPKNVTICILAQKHQHT